MNRTYEDMSKEELVTLVKRLTKQHDEWSDEAKHLRMMYEELYADWRKVWDILDNTGMAKEMRQEFPNTFADTMELIE
jgi:predicted YcjX-like family ATPase